MKTRRERPARPTTRSSIPQKKECLTMLMPFVFTFFSLLILNLQSDEPFFSSIPKEWSMDSTEQAKLISGESFQQRTTNQFSHEYGYCMCVGEDSAMVSDAIYTIKRLRTHWKSPFRFTVAHCSELSESTKRELYRAHDDAIRASQVMGVKGEFPTLAIMDMCKGAPVSKKKRLRSFFCKPAALVLDTSQKTMLIDTDIVWFENPDMLFQAPGFLQTGALFFRDRHFISMAVETPLSLDRGLHYEPVVDLMNTQRKSSRTHNADPVISSYYSKEEGRLLAQNHRNGTNYFWRCAYDSEECRRVIHNQDSSVVLLDKKRNFRTVEELRRLIPTFGLGYGDKEIYWISATIAGDAHSWEPYLLGNYGPCGDMLHFNPDVPRSTKSNATSSAVKEPVPYFMNAQFIVEGVHYVGEGMRNLYTQHRVASLDSSLEGCGCEGDAVCLEPSSEMQNTIRLQQTFMLERTGEPPSAVQKRIRHAIRRIRSRILPSWLN